LRISAGLIIGIASRGQHEATLTTASLFWNQRALLHCEANYALPSLRANKESQTFDATLNRRV
jgi:hypothetical protein